MHHERYPSQEMTAAFLQQPGPTGRFPEGKLTANDEGEIAFAVGTLKGKVVLNFGTPVASIGMTPSQARLLANDLFRRANQVERK